MTRLFAVLTLMLLAGCGEEFTSYEKPYSPVADNETDDQTVERLRNSETEWHRCMRQKPILHRFECRDSK